MVNAAFKIRPVIEPPRGAVWAEPVPVDSVQFVSGDNPGVPPTPIAPVPVPRARGLNPVTKGILWVACPIAALAFLVNASSWSDEMFIGVGRFLVGVGMALAGLGFVVWALGWRGGGVK